MHSVFLVDEIFKVICENVAGSQRGLASLATLARTCRSLEGISLDALWGHGQVQLVDVLKTLPPDSWSVIDSTFVWSNFFHELRTNADIKLSF